MSRHQTQWQKLCRTLKKATDISSLLNNPEEVSALGQADRMTLAESLDHAYTTIVRLTRAILQFDYRRRAKRQKIQEGSCFPDGFDGGG